MSKKRKIHWSKTNGRDEQNIFSLLGSMSVWSGILLDVLCAILFVCAARLIMEDVFGYQASSFMNILSMVFVGLLVSVAMEVARCYGRRIRFSIYAATLVVGLIICWFIISFITPWDSMGVGFMKIGSDYILFWNKYFNTSMDVKRMSVDVAETLNFATFILFYISLWFAKLRRNNMTTMILPLLVFVAVMLVGYSPKETSLFVIFIAIMISNANSFRRTDFVLARRAKGSRAATGGLVGVSRVVGHFTWAILALGIWLLCVLTSTWGLKPAAKIIEGAPEFKVTVNEIIEDIKNADWNQLLGNIVNTPNRAVLTNDTPEYQNKVVMNLTLSKRGSGNIYMKGFHANTYHNGVWDEDLTAFNKALKENGASTKTVARELAGMTGSALMKTYAKDSLADIGMSAKLTINYKNKSDSKAYIPYFSEVTDKSISAQGDGLYLKSKTADSVEMNIWKYGGDYDTRIQTFSGMEAYQWEEWYSAFVATEYIQVPDYLIDAVDDVLAEIDQMSNSIDGITSNISGINGMRLSCTYDVIMWMQLNTSYSLTPPELPDGVDPIVFFLEDSRQGYCMHYASAATMLLRRMGVPARYVSGYVVASANFKEADTAYELQVMDNMAHAWVEIYLDGIGWVPVEATQGYNTDIMNIIGGMVEMPTVDPDVDVPEISTPEATTPEATTPEPTTPEQTTSEPSKINDEIDNTNRPTGHEPDNNMNIIADEENESSSQSYASLGDTMKVLVPVVILVSLAGWGVFRLYRSHATYIARLRSDIEHRRTKKVIRKINRRIYNRLRRSGRILKGSITDEEYNAILKKAYPHIEPIDWNRFINIAKAAAFSTVDFTEEEMNFCLKLWDAIDSKSKN